MFWVVGGLWRVGAGGGGQGRGGWIKESVNLVSVGGWVCVCVGVLSVGLGPGLDTMSPARSRRSASHAAGTHGWLPQKTGRPGLRRGGVGGYNLYSVPPNSPPDCGTVAHQPRAGCIRLVLSITFIGCFSRALYQPHTSGIQHVLTMLITYDFVSYLLMHFSFRVLNVPWRIKNLMII